MLFNLPAFSNLYDELSVLTPYLGPAECGHEHRRSGLASCCYREDMDTTESYDDLAEAYNLIFGVRLVDCCGGSIPCTASHRFLYRMTSLLHR